MSLTESRCAPQRLRGSANHEIRLGFSASNSRLATIALTRGSLKTRQ